MKEEEKCSKSRARAMYELSVLLHSELTSIRGPGDPVKRQRDRGV